MDWYDWLSRTNLDKSLIRDYGLAFARNALEEEDIVHFNHDLLQSLGITVAKHRLEILTLVRKELGRTPSGLGKLGMAFHKMLKSFSENIAKCACQTGSTRMHPWEGFAKQRNGGPKKHSNIKKHKLEKTIVTSHNVMSPGPPDTKLFVERWMSTNRSTRKLENTDGKWRKTLAYASRSPVIHGPWQGKSPRRVLNQYHGESLGIGDGGYSQWSLKFQDLKPT